MSRVCSCSSPDCMKNGCMLDRVHFSPPSRYMHPIPPGIPIAPKPDECRIAPTVTEQDIRRIVREEIARALKDQPAQEKT